MSLLQRQNDELAKHMQAESRRWIVYTPRAQAQPFHKWRVMGHEFMTMTMAGGGNPNDPIYFGRFEWTNMMHHFDPKNQVNLGFWAYQKMSLYWQYF